MPGEQLDLPISTAGTADRLPARISPMQPTAGVAPFALRVIYRDRLITVVALVLAIAITVGVEYALRLRVDEAIGDLEMS